VSCENLIVQIQLKSVLASKCLEIFGFQSKYQAHEKQFLMAPFFALCSIKLGAIVPDLLDP